jgi:hypothetical protein
MNLTDFFLIYLSCGAPFGVYFFLQHRKHTPAPGLWLKSFLTVFVWIPYAFRLLHDFVTRRSKLKDSSKGNSVDFRLHKIQKAFFQLQSRTQTELPPFEFREVIERYTGLTLASLTNGAEPTPPEKEIFRVALRKNTELGAECLHRRNRERLLFHQILAREDFLKTLTRIKETVSETSELKDLATEFTQILGDEEAAEAVGALFNEKRQSVDETSVKTVENVVWKSTEHKPSIPASRTPIHSR